MKILNRMLIAEISPLFLYGVLAFSAMLIGIGTLYQIAYLMIDYHISFIYFIEIFFLKLPFNIIMTFPMATLFATLLTFSRISNDFELVALNTSGISFIRTLIPIIFFSFFITLLTLILNEKLVPFTNSKSKELIWEIKSSGNKNLKQEKVLQKEMEDGEVKRIIYSKSLKGQQLNRVSLYEYKNDKIYRFTTAEKAIYNNGNWIFQNGSTYKINKNGDPQLVVKFSKINYIINSTPAGILKKQREVEDLNLYQTAEMIKLYKKEQTDPREIKKLEVSYQHKLSLPFASFFFALLGAPLGIKPHRTSTSIGFGLSLIIIFLYYIIMTASRIWGQGGIISPFWAAWLPNILVFIPAVYFIYKANSILR